MRLLASLLLVGLLWLAGCSKSNPPGGTLPSPSSARSSPSTRPILGSPPFQPTPAFALPPGVTEPVELSRVRPVIPDGCRGARFSGIFIFDATIDAAGNVQGVKTVHRASFDPPCPAFENACKRAISQWKYRPATQNGVPVSVSLTVTSIPHS